MYNILNYCAVYLKLIYYYKSTILQFKKKIYAIKFWRDA